MEKHIEREYITERGNKFVESSIFGKCRVLTKEQVHAEFEENEEFDYCETPKNSKYTYYIDGEICKYYASLKGEK